MKEKKNRMVWGVLTILVMSVFSLHVTSCGDGSEEIPDIEENDKQDTEKIKDDSIVGKAIDLGLSVCWSSFNMGATKPHETGNFYMWGELDADTEFVPENYRYFDVTMRTYADIGSDISETGYDAAHVKWKDGWRMATYTEWMELIEKCTWEWIRIDEKNGYQVTGPNGNSIFLPSGGPSGTVQNDKIYYWSSTIGSEQNAIFIYATSQQIYNNAHNTSLMIRHGGLPIRPVRNYRSEGTYDITIKPEKLDFSEKEQQNSFAVHLDREGVMNVSSDADWCTPINYDFHKPSKHFKLPVKVSENKGAERTAKITVRVGDSVAYCYVTQKGKSD